MQPNKNTSIYYRQHLRIAAGAHFATDFYNGFLGPLMPMLVIKLNLTLAMAGGLYSIFSIANSLVQPIAGMFADRMNRNIPILFGPLITAVFMGFIGRVTHYEHLLLILVMSGTGTALFHPPGAAMVGRLNHRRRGFAMSIFNTTGALGVAAGSLIIVPYSNQFGLNSTIWLMVPALIFFIYSFRVLSNEKFAHERHRTHHTELFRLLKTHGWLIFHLFAMVVLRAAITLTFSGFIPLYLTSRGKSATFGGVALAIFQLFSTAGMLVGGHLFDRIGTKKILYISFVFVIPLAVAVVNLPSTGGLFFLALLGFFISSSTSVNIILGQEIAPEQSSFMSSIMMGFSWGVAGLLMTLIGAIADRIGLYWTLTGVSGLSLIGLIFVAVLRYEDKPVADN